MKVKTEELTGAALDWAVNLCLSEDDIYELYGAGMVGNVSPGVNFKPSADWAQAGPLINKFCPSFKHIHGLVICEVNGAMEYGGDYLTATSRAVVACKLGEEVEIPDELMEAA